jgi:1-acyl-sn-glycerol-3-phosphate acyltransferase
VLILRSSLFYIGYALATTWFGITGLLLFSWFPYRIRAPYLLLWNRFTLFWLRLTCGVRYVLKGGDNIPNGPIVALSKHESQWETFYLQLALHPIATILKKELLDIPGFGWGLRQMQPIPIDRGSPREAIRQMLRLGEERIAAGLSVLVFPEGTRTAPGKTARFARGGANLAIQAKVPVVPIAHNAASFWPAHQWTKHPGTITVSFGKPIDTRDKGAAEVTEAARAWIEAEIAGFTPGNSP